MRLLTGVATATLACLLLAGCSAGNDGPTKRPTNTTTSTGASDVSAKTAKEALAFGGLTLPRGAGDETFATLDDTPYLEAYLVTFKVPRSEAIGFCSSGELGGDLPALKLSSEEQQLLVSDAKPEGNARHCSSQLPSDTAWNRTVLVETGNPALVRVSVARMGR